MLEQLSEIVYLMQYFNPVVFFWQRCVDSMMKTDDLSSDRKISVMVSGEAPILEITIKNREEHHHF